MRYLFAILILTAAVLFNISGVYAAENNTEIYVSENGNDLNSGTENAPVRTFERAKELVREINDGNTDICVNILQGKYSLENTLLFSAEDGGKDGSSVTYRGIGDVVISGNRVLDGWQLYDSDKNIYRAAVPAGFETRQLYVNGEKALRSRSTLYGNNPYENLNRTCELGIAARNNKEFYFYANEVENWNNFEAVEIHLLTAWTDNMLRLKKYDGEMNFKPVLIDNGGSEGTVNAVAVKIQEPESERLFNRPHPDITGSTLGYKSRSYYYFENAYEFIDEDNEWYLDTTENAIYFKAPKGMNVEEAVFEAPILETLVRIGGTSQLPVTNLKFENIVFEGSTWLLPSKEGLVGGQACQYVLTSNLKNEITSHHPASGFYAEYAENLELNSCVFRKMGSTAVDLFCGVSDSRIVSCQVYDCAGNGISVAKFTEDENTEFHEAYNPTDKSEICRNVIIANNSIHNIGTEMEGAVAIVAGYPEKIVIANNEIYNVPYSGISVGFGWTSADNAMKNNIIFRNRLHDVGLAMCDFGAIYTLSKQPESLCAQNYIYNVERKPWFDYGYSAMYFDEQTEGYTITENVLHNIGSDAWGGGINFNGCASKNSNTNNIRVNGELTSEALAVTENTGIKKEKTADELAYEARRYLYEIQNPKEPYDPSDYSITKLLNPIDAWTVGTVGSTKAEYAIDQNPNTVFSVTGQTEGTISKQYLVVELDGNSVLSRVEIDREYNAGGMTSDNNYWADWCLAVGCEIQGSFDAEAWETIGVMNTWPDGWGETSKEVFNLENPKPYKYVRYIRTKYKKGSDYGVWRWSSSDGGNRLNVKDIRFYTSTECSNVAITNVTATGCDEDSNPEYAVDGDSATVYTLSNQTAQSISEQYLLLETDGTEDIYKIIIRRKYNAGGMTSDNNYWADWCLAVGCEIQGSFDAEAWETIGVMNTWPDGWGETSKEIFVLENPKPYKYVRYIRTKYKTGSDYGVWRWSSSDGGNRLNVAEIELYTAASYAVRIVDAAKDDGDVVFTVESTVDGSFTAYLADYNNDGKLLNVASANIDVVQGISEYSISGDKKDEGVAASALYLWDGMRPVAEKYTII